MDTEILTQEKYGFLAVPCTATV